jgi:hypothetical protein
MWIKLDDSTRTKRTNLLQELVTPCLRPRERVANVDMLAGELRDRLVDDEVERLLLHLVAPVPPIRGDRETSVTPLAHEQATCDEHEHASLVVSELRDDRVELAQSEVAHGVASSTQSAQM